eukprot:gnl/Carplike_NY0171/480_a665_3561.p1 GENE.gnl/Carplike_NY0171/480_a665_3561~~gnl/Carplike_NY0171/480_a665_3561.p1  ORF type:complete len:277 (+),score=70.79 gnl/Carplike_NY0171/480_a665_3561:99-929(+)
MNVYTFSHNKKYRLSVSSSIDKVECVKKPSSLEVSTHFHCLVCKGALPSLKLGVPLLFSPFLLQCISSKKYVICKPGSKDKNGDYQLALTPEPNLKHMRKQDPTVGLFYPFQMGQTSGPYSLGLAMACPTKPMVKAATAIPQIPSSIPARLFAPSAVPKASGDLQPLFLSSYKDKVTLEPFCSGGSGWKMDDITAELAKVQRPAPQPVMIQQPMMVAPRPTMMLVQPAQYGQMMPMYAAPPRADSRGKKRRKKKTKEPKASAPYLQYDPIPAEYII